MIEKKIKYENVIRKKKKYACMLIIVTYVKVFIWHFNHIKKQKLAVLQNFAYKTGWIVHILQILDHYNFRYFC